jgi:DNA-binding NarL/FixJ family response regulator
MSTDINRVSRPAGIPQAEKETKVTSVFVVDALTAIRELVVNFVNGIDGFVVVGATGSRGEAERECARLQPHIALIDWMLMADHSSINLAEALRKCSPTTKVVVFSAAADTHFVSDAIAAGVAGFVVKTAPLDTLTRGLRAVVDGKQFFCPEMAGVLRDLLRSSSLGSGRASFLSHREKEVLREIAKGRFSKEIAATFKLSVFTIENIRRRIMRKTGLKSVAELTLHAVRLQLVTAPTNGSDVRDDV